MGTRAVRSDDETNALLNALTKGVVSGYGFIEVRGRAGSVPSDGASGVDGLTLLVADHDVIRALIARFRVADEVGDIRAMTMLGRQVLAELMDHIVAEETLVYPTVGSASSELGPLVADAVYEHNDIRMAVQEIRSLQAARADFAPDLCRLALDVEGHFRGEEVRLFPRCREVLDRDTLRDLGRQIVEARGHHSESPEVRFTSSDEVPHPRPIAG